MDKESIRDYELDIIVKAWRDEAFRRSLLKDAKRAIEKEFGIDIPNDVEISVHEEHENSIHLIVPSIPSNFDAEKLSDDELRDVIGGVFAGGHLSGFPDAKERARLRDLQRENDRLKKIIEGLKQDLGKSR